MNTTLQLLELGQSVWYDNIQRSLLVNGTLKSMIDRQEIRGVTSNPTIFMNAIAKTNDYDASLALLGKQSLHLDDLFFKIAIEDIQAAADLFLPLYLQTQGGDGYVSLEVNPHLAHDTAGTITQAKLLWQQVNRPNLMIKIPATQEGIPAIKEAIQAGINVNVTLIFSRDRYAAVMDAYLSGLEARLQEGKSIEHIASVASFFVSRVDSNIDPRLKTIASENANQSTLALSLLGKAAIANARLAYQDHLKVFTAPRFLKLQAKSAKVQRPLWASTGTKDPAYSDVLYVEELIGINTVNTIPPQTLAAFLDHGKVRHSLVEDLSGAAKVISEIETLGISMHQVTAQLEQEGVKSFNDAFDTLLSAIQSRL